MAKRICKVCGEEYDYCPGCPKHAGEPKWKISFDTENCKNIFDTLVKHSVGKITTKEARRALYKLDLSGKNHFAADVRDKINSIMNTNQNSEAAN